MTILVLTGTEAAGKTTIADALAQRGSAAVVRAVTTRARREGDNGRYRYVSAEQFARHRLAKDLVVDTEYRGHQYGILVSDLTDARATGKTPVLTLTPSSMVDYQRRATADDMVLSFFVDAADETLNERLTQRGSAADADRRVRDRSFRAQATYPLQNDRRLEDVLDVIECLLALQGKGGILPHQIIATLARGGLLIDNYEVSNIQAASYDLMLGDEYYYGGRIKRLSPTKPILTIKPYDSAIVTSRERARMPRDTAGRFDLSVGLFSQGIILSNGPQIDPGFEGSLFCLLLNTSSSPVLLRRGQHYATLEFSRLVVASDQPYAGARQGKQSILDYLPANAARGAINELKRDLEYMRKEGARLQTFFIAALSLMFAVAALFTATR